PRQETGVRVDEDKDVAPESRKNCMQRRSRPRTLSLRDQTESRLALRAILYHAFGSIRATACNHQDLLQQKSGGENLGREGLEQCRKPPSLVVRAYSDTDVRGCVASRAADETSRNGTGRSLLGQHPVRRLNAVLDEAQTEPRRFDDRLAAIRSRNGDLQCDCPRDCQSRRRARERELRAFGTTMMLENPFRRMFLSSKLRLDGSGSIATTVAALVAALNVYSPMCAPASTTTSPIPTWNHSAVKGSYLPEIKS